MPVISYVNPDEFYFKPLARTFFYTIRHNLYWAIGNDTHFEMVEQQPALAEELGFKPQDFRDDRSKSRERLRWEKEEAILGRAIAQEDKTIISIWNEDVQFVLSLIQPCIEAILPRLYQSTETEPKNDCLVCTPFKTNWWSKWRLAKANPTGKNVELYRNLHLMKPQEKRNAMEKLGLQTQTKQSPWSTAMSQAGLLTPGQKAWAAQSESFKEWLNQTEMHKCQGCDRMIAGKQPYCLFCQSKLKKAGKCTRCGEGQLSHPDSKYCKKCQAGAIERAHPDIPKSALNLGY
jgi:hypothetical protein